MKLSILILILLTFTKLHTQELKIYLQPSYCEGVFTVNSISDLNEYLFMNRISFQGGPEIGFLKDAVINDMYLHGLGGLVILDSTTTLCFKKDEKIKKNYHGKKFKNNNWQFMHHTNNPDTNWYSALEYPKEKLSADSFTFDPKYNYDSVITKQSSFFMNFEGSELPDPFPSIYERMDYDYKAIIYLKSHYNRHIKLQIIDYDIYETTYGPNNSPRKYISFIKFRWAADYAGNGIFDHGTSNIIYINNKRKAHFKVYNNTLTINSEIQNSNLLIFNAKGQFIKSIKIESDKRSVKLNLSPGIYFLEYAARSKTLSYRFVIQ